MLLYYVHLPLCSDVRAYLTDWRNIYVCVPLFVFDRVGSYANANARARALLVLRLLCLSCCCYLGFGMCLVLGGAACCVLAALAAGSWQWQWLLASISDDAPTRVLRLLSPSSK